MRSKQCIVVGTMPGFETNNRVYSGGGISPCINARDYKDAKKIIVESVQRDSDRADGQHERPHA